MQTGKIITDIQELETNEAAFDSLINYIGKRTRHELKTILGLKRKAFSFLADKCGREKNLDTEFYAFLAAAQSYRRHRPHNARTLALIEKERQERNARHPKGRGLRGRLEEDFADVTLFLDGGYSWKQIAQILKTRNTKYRGLSMNPETLRKTYSRIKSAMPLEEFANVIDLPDPPTAPPEY